MSWFIFGPGRIPKSDTFRSSTSLSEAQLKGYVAAIEGAVVDQWDQSIVLKPETPADDGTPQEVLVSGWVAPIVHRRVQESLEAAGVQDVQFLPIRVQHFDGSEIPGYAVLNVTSTLYSLDEPSPKFGVESLTEDLQWPSPEVLPSERLIGHDAVRNQPKHPLVYVSDRFRQAFESVTHGQYVFVPVDVS